MKKILAILLTLTLICAMPVVAYADGANAPIEAVVDNGWVIFGAIVCVTVAIIAFIKFLQTPREEQLNKVREWLLLAVMRAEKEFGADTGVLKLRVVYDLFVTKFPWLAKIISFDRFAALVDDALDEMRKLLATKPDLLEEIKIE